VIFCSVVVFLRKTTPSLTLLSSDEWEVLEERSVHEKVVEFVDEEGELLLSLPEKEGMVGLRSGIMGKANGKELEWKVG
jgi:hypothetical protein